MPLFITELSQAFPQLQVEVFEIKTEEIISRLKLGNLDCGIFSTPVSVSGVQFEPLFYKRIFAYVSENHSLFSEEKINTDDINEEDIWYLEEGKCFQNQFNSICKIDSQKKILQNLVYCSNSIESLRRIVENKNGITFIPE